MFVNLKTIGIGRTSELNLRVSAGVLNRVEMDHPLTGERLLVLERRLQAYISPDKQFHKRMYVQPLGGSSRLHRPEALLSKIGHFNYADEHAKDNQDLRLFINPQDLKKTVQFTQFHFENKETNVIRLNAKHELYEELLECLGFYQTSHQGLLNLISQLTTETKFPSDQIIKEIEFQSYHQQTNEQLSELRNKYPQHISRIFNHIQLVEIKNKALPSYLIDMENLITDEDLELVVYKKCHWRDDKNEEPKAFASGLFITSLQQLMTHFENHPKQNRGLFSQYQNYLLAESVAQMLEP